MRNTRITHHDRIRTHFTEEDNYDWNTGRNGRNLLVFVDKVVDECQKYMEQYMTWIFLI